MNVLAVMVGGFFGAITRYGMGEWIHTAGGFPIGTLLVNLVGCLLLGWFFGFTKQKPTLNSKFVLLIGTGFIGSFTTFSTFSVETVNLLVEGEIVLTIIYIFLSIIIGLFLSFLGFKLSVHKYKSIKEGNVQ